MRRSNSLIAVCLVAVCMTPAPGNAAYKPPACFKRDKLEASLKGERKIPYDAQAPRLKNCHVTQPLVSEDLRREGKTRVAIFVFDVTGSGEGKGEGCRGTQPHPVIPGVDFEILVCATR